MQAEPPTPQLISTVRELIQVKTPAEPKVDIQAEIQEHHLRKENAMKIRIGGISDWQHENDTFDEAINKIKAAIPAIDWSASPTDDKNDDEDESSPVNLSPRNGHVVITFNSKTLKKRILQQSYKLKGTKIWIAEELTRTQLKNKATKLAKVRAAREARKWAP